MKKVIAGLLLLIVCSCTRKKETEEQVLRQRFSEFIKAIAEDNDNKAKDFIYPRLFSIIPRDEMSVAMDIDEDDPEEKVEIDSVRIDTIHPIARVDKGSYTIAVYSLRLQGPVDTTTIVTKNPLDTNKINHLVNEQFAAPQVTLMATLMKDRYGFELTDLTRAGGNIIMKVKFPVIAVKDEYSKEWSFVTMINDQELINKLFSRKVLEKLASYNRNE